MLVDIVEVGIGNIRSVKHWLTRAGIQSSVVSDPKSLSANTIILPGVGSAGIFMQKLKQHNFDKAITEHVHNKRRLIGICLGFQIMCKSTEEDGGVEGLGILKAHVEKLENKNSHNQWQSFSIDKRNMNGQSLNSSMSLSNRKIINGRVFYNHEFGVVNNDTLPWTASISKELIRYSAMAVSETVIGIQFHPEKSQSTGLELIKLIL